MLTAIVSSKTTVVGIRLDHDRRAWVQAEAAREGVSVRAWFERLIDEARAGEGGTALAIGGTTTTEAGAEAGAESTSKVGAEASGEGVPEPPAPAAGGEEARVRPSSHPLGEPSAIGTADTRCADLTVLPARVVRGSLCLPVALVRQAGRWARWGCRTGVASGARVQALVLEHLGPTA